MLRVPPLGPSSATRPEAVTPWQRQTLMALLVGLGALVNVAFNYAGSSLDVIVQDDSCLAMMGGSFAQASLLAVWAGLGRPSLATRVPWALGAGALLGLAVDWGEARQQLEGGKGPSSATFMVFVVGVQAVPLFPLRRYWNWRVHTGDDTAPPERSQFSLKQLLLWTTAAATILAIGRWIGLRDGHTVAAMTRMARDAAICGLVATVCLALVNPSISLILGNGNTRPHST